jgi:hypothetical protein
MANLICENMRGCMGVRCEANIKLFSRLFTPSAWPRVVIFRAFEFPFTNAEVSADMQPQYITI